LTPHPALHPFTNWKLRVYVANFVLRIRHRCDLRLSGHDQRDLDFVNKYALGNIPSCVLMVRIPRALSSPTPL